ncbi:hypothetical protein FC35_GL000673 [Limosilactobacillus coleohominis DSM 14060]|nr:hypothetical protein FC35_GL000673 [Limosilactobacillus coleohominis DSM 14060]
MGSDESFDTIQKERQSLARLDAQIKTIYRSNFNMEIGLDEARRLYEELPDDIKDKQKAVKLTKELLIDQLWCGNDQALKLAYGILADREQELRKSVGWD